MNRYGRGTIGNPSKASASTQCQKCLKRDMCSRHYTYECKAPAQERPYVSRPSRTQQLYNPKLLSKLTTDVPNDLLRKKGVADEQLARAEAERGRKRERQSEDRDVQEHAGKRVKSRSGSVSSVSVSTISTSRSRSPSPVHPIRGSKSRIQSRSLSKSPLRRRLKSLSMSRSPAPKRRRNSPSPSRSPPPRSKALDAQRKRRRSSDASTDSDSSTNRKGSRERPDSRSTRRRFRQLSPLERGRRTESRSPERGRPRLSSNHQQQKDEFAGHVTLPKPENRPREKAPAREAAPPKERVPAKERSLSPFSKRLALTQAMNRGR